MSTFGLLPVVFGFHVPTIFMTPRPGCTSSVRQDVHVRMFDETMFNHYANPGNVEGSSLGPITEYPNPILRASNAEVTEFDDKLVKLCDEFFAMMYAATGVGIAAPQVGLNIQLFVYNTDPTAPGALKKMGQRVVANPKILEYSQATDVEIEGCLSSRSECCRGNIRLSKEIRVECVSPARPNPIHRFAPKRGSLFTCCCAAARDGRFQDERGRVKTKKLRGFEARVFQHEYDHLQGVLHIDRQSAADRLLIQPYLEKLVEIHGPGGVLEPKAEVLAGLQPPPGLAEPPNGSTPPTRRKAGAAAAAASVTAESEGDEAVKSRGFGGSAGKGGKVGSKKAGKKKKR